jgi:hypothetical protein
MKTLARNINGRASGSRPDAQKPCWSARAQTKLTTFRPAAYALGSNRFNYQESSAAEEARTRMSWKGAFVAPFIVLAGMSAAAILK